MRTIQLSLSMRDIRAFMVEDRRGQPHVVHAVTVEPFAEIIHPRNQIFGSLPDSFRFFLVQEAPPGEGVEGTIGEALGAQLAEAGAGDLKRASQLWASGKREEARRLRDQIMTDLGVWLGEFMALRGAAGQIAEAIADVTVRQEAEAILRLREEVSSEADRDLLKAARAQSDALFSLLTRWAKIHTPVAERIPTAALSLAEGMTKIHVGKVIPLLDDVAGEENLYIQAKVDKVLRASGFLADGMVADLRKMSEVEPKVVGKVRNSVRETAQALVDGNRRRANALFRPLTKLKRREKDLKRQVLVSLKENTDWCLERLAAWSSTFPELAKILDAEKARDPEWNRRDWGKSKPVPAASLGDAAAALAEEIQRSR